MKLNRIKIYTNSLIFNLKQGLLEKPQQMLRLFQ